MKQLTQDEALKIYERGEWRDWTDSEVVKYQLFQDRLFVPFDRFHQATEKVPGRPVFTHEFAFNCIKEEYLGIREAPTFDEIVGLLRGSDHAS